MKRLKKITPIITVLFVLTSILFFCYITIFDSEWRGNQILEKVRSYHPKLLQYKQRYSIYPDSLSNVHLYSNYCLITYCYELKYWVSPDKQSYTLVSKVDDPFIVFLSSSCPNVLGTDENKAAICASFAFRDDYQGDRNDWPIYKKDKIFLATPSAWPSLK